MNSDNIIGIVYLLVSTIGMTVNILVIYLKTKFRKDHYSNVTFRFMILLAISDSMALFVVGFMGGFMVFFPSIQTDIVFRFCGYIIGIGWYSGSFFLAIISFSRYVAIAQYEKLAFYFTEKRLKWISIFPWVFYMVYFSTSFWRQSLEFK